MQSSAMPGTVLNDFFWPKLHFLFIALPWVIMASYENFYLQGQPLGFDTKYLALGDRNMQVRFSLKVVWES